MTLNNPNTDSAASNPTPSGNGNTTDRNNSNSNNNGGNGNRSGNGRFSRNTTNTNVSSTNTNAFEGSNKDLGAVLGLRHEKLKIKSPSFENFIEKVCTYVISTYKDGADLKPLFRKMKDPVDDFKTKEKPVKPANGSDDVDNDIYREEIKLYVTRTTNLRRNMDKSFGLVWGQCSNQLQAIIKGLTNYDEMYDRLDVLWLVKELKKATSGIDSKSDPRLTFHRAMSELYKLRQGEAEGNDKYLERFQSCVNTVELAQGKDIFCIDSMAKSEGSVGLSDEDRAIEEQRSKAVLFLELSDMKRYGNLSSDLENSAALGRHEYPHTVGAMYEVMVKQRGLNNRTRTGTSFAQQHHSIINPNWILLDTCSTDNVFCNPFFVSNLIPCDSGDELSVVTNEGYCT